MPTISDEDAAFIGFGTLPRLFGCRIEDSTYQNLAERLKSKPAEPEISQKDKRKKA